MPVAGHALTSSVCFGLSSFGRWESIQFGLAKQEVFLRFCCCEARSSCTVPQPMADADKDADQHSDEIMEPGEDAVDALPLGDGRPTSPTLTLFQQLVVVVTSMVG